MVHYHHQSLFVSTFMVFCFLPFLWSVKPDKDEQSPVQGFTGYSDDYKISSTSSSSSSSSSVNLFNSVQNEPNILNTTTKTTLPLSTLSPSSITKSLPSSTIINNSVSSKSSADNELNSIKNYSTFDPSLSSTTNNYNNITLINLSQSPLTTINSTIISSQSLSTSQQQQQDQQQQLPIETSSQSFPPPFLEFVALSAFGLLVAISFLVAGVYGCVKVYHSRYPVRITFGRKFSTFENPIYVQKASSSCEIDNSRENQAGPTGIEA